MHILRPSGWFRGLIGIAIVTAIIGIAHVCLLDGIDGTVFASILGEDTEYAAGYSAQRFRSVKPGMTPEQVIGLLREPLSTTKFGEDMEFWAYSRTRNDSSYRVRGVIFKHGIVARLRHEYYAD